jgi:hypothetical protein
MSHDDKMPLELNKPDFKYEFNSWLPFQLNLEVGEDGHKTEAQSILRLATDNGGYPMKLMFKTWSQEEKAYVWYQSETHEIGILIEGSWERDGVIEAMQRAGLMLMPYYGTMNSQQEEDDAIREQTKTL